MVIKFLANRSTIIFGSSGAGKTEFMLSVIRQKLIEPWPKNVFYMYGVDQPFMTTWNETESTPIKFIKGLNFDEIDTLEPSVLIMDDLLLSNNQNVAEIFTAGSHHRKISTFFMTQSLFPNCPIFRTMSANSSYFVLFHSQRHFRQINTLAHQIFVGQEVNRIINAYKRVAKRQRGFIVLSFDPELPDELTVVTDWFEVCPSVYL